MDVFHAQLIQKESFPKPMRLYCWIIEGNFIQEGLIGSTDIYMLLFSFSINLLHLFPSQGLIDSLKDLPLVCSACKGGLFQSLSRGSHRCRSSCLSEFFMFLCHGSSFTSVTSSNDERLKNRDAVREL